MIFLEVNGIRYENFKSASVAFSMDAFARDFEFVATAADNENPLPFKGGEACKVFIDDDQVLNGSIEIVDGDYDSESHNINIIGRGRAADIADSTINNLELTSPISLQAAVEAMIKEFESDVTVNDLVGGLELFNVAEDQLGSSGEGGFDFIETLARKRQVLLNENGEGNIDIVRASKDKYQQKLQNIKFSDSNNIKRGNFSYDLTRTYRKYIVRSQLNATAMSFSGETDLKEASSQLGELTDDNVRKGRQLAFIAEKASSNDQLNERAIWESNIRRARSRLYNVTFVGHKTKHDEQWVVNKLISINDEFAGIKEDMLVNSIIFTQSSEGNLTEIGLIDKDAYTPNPADTLSDDVGQGIVF